MQTRYFNKFISILLIQFIGVVIFMFTGCYSESDYSGVGKLTDNGPSAATDRYILDLGTVDLSKIGTTTYRIANLPAANFVAGIDFSVESINQEIISNNNLNTSVSISLADSNGEEIFNKNGRLANWSWARKRIEPTKAFIYGSGSGLEQTYFDPKPHAEYVLKFTVLKIDSTHIKHEATLKLKSGGWK